MNDDGICPKCRRPADDHCFKCEAPHAVLCPFKDKHGEYHTPCQKVGPSSKEKAA